MSNKLNTLDLFCGIGGTTQGLSQVNGIDVKLGIDYNQTALKTYKNNHNHNTITHDLSIVKPNIITNKYDIDYIHASPPCQGFSNANKNRNPDDKRNTLMFKTLEWIEEIEPTYVTLENVTGIKHIETPQGKPVTDAIINKLHSLGYSAHYEKINCANYGVPQTRKRVIFFAVKQNAGHSQQLVPPKTHSKEEWVGVETILETYCDQVPSEDRYGTPQKGKQAYYLQNPDRPAYTITGSNAMGPSLYPTDDGRYRRFSPEECALFQSFHPSYDLSNLNKTTKYNLVGNAVPPLLAKQIGQQIYKHYTGQNEQKTITSFE